MTDRRSFLRLFGASTAAVATAEGIETVSSRSAPLEFKRDVGATVMPHGNLFDVRPDVLYQRLEIAKNSMVEAYHGFSVGLGMPMPDGTYADRSVTNMLQRNQLPAPNAFQIRKLGIVFSPSTEPRLRSAFLDRYYMELMIEQKAYWRTPLSFMFSVVELERDENGLAILPDKGLADIGEIPLIVNYGVYFSVGLYGAPIQPCGRLKLWIVMEGLMARGVQ